MNQTILGRKVVGRQQLNSNEYKRRTSTRNIVVHCSDTPSSMNIGAKEIREWHTKERQWDDIGYHFVIRRDGTLERGRPQWAIGAGVRGHNADSVHICVVGGKGTPGTFLQHFTLAQEETLKLITLALTAEYPEATVLGHTDFPDEAKTCPNFNAIAWFNSIPAGAWERLVADYMNEKVTK